MTDSIYAQRSLEIGARVRVRDGIDVPEWATTGTIRSLPGPNSDNYDHPLVTWDVDGRSRTVPSSWLVVVPPTPTKIYHLEIHNGPGPFVTLSIHATLKGAQEIVEKRVQPTGDWTYVAGLKQWELDVRGRGQFVITERELQK